MEARRDVATRSRAYRRIGEQLGVNPEALRNWVQRAETDRGLRPGTITDDATRLVELEREVRELRRANTILRQASAFFAAKLDRPSRRCARSSTNTAMGTGSSRSAGCLGTPIADQFHYGRARNQSWALSRCPGLNSEQCLCKAVAVDRSWGQDDREAYTRRNQQNRYLFRRARSPCTHDLVTCLYAQKRKIYQIGRLRLTAVVARTMKGPVLTG